MASYFSVGTDVWCWAETYKIMSSSFNVGHGTQQGVPLSPLLFCFSIDSVVEANFKEPNILGVKPGA